MPLPVGHPRLPAIEQIALGGGLVIRALLRPTVRTEAPPDRARAVARESAARYSATDFHDEVLDAMRGSIPEEPHLHPIALLEDFIRDLERDDVIAPVAGNDPDSHRELLADVKLMWEQLAAINAAEPVSER